MSTNQNRYGIYKQARLPKQKRTLRVLGDLDDSGKYYRCWNCGFICDAERDQLGEYGGSNPITYVDTDGVTKYKPDIGVGCPFCGSTNYR